MTVTISQHWMLYLIDITIEQGDRTFTWEVETLGL
ncbi:hypothetical protein PP747_gp002 [Rhizobium phage RHph_Y38]|uniref:Uncharacterized protein n=2 Tax=Acanvirus TaxID=3044653 RepID=A0A7S5UU31_9CAUD|nr:hypothetical protein PP747_gp002 [Rhizobium phage RHph_Y38]YP_010658112.1 hypothetical protein PP748_gp002 [Rhizobium phage RHph_Y2_6]QIG67703.1 hypothetical protein EVB52_002 [Rhizobium phage RHph_Y38]QIG68739.1 hypothetical protein EVB68_002 [Rhizobium phage RHph_Y2_6]